MFKVSSLTLILSLDRVGNINSSVTELAVSAELRVD